MLKFALVFLLFVFAFIAILPAVYSKDYRTFSHFLPVIVLIFASAGVFYFIRRDSRSSPSEQIRRMIRDSPRVFIVCTCVAVASGIRFRIPLAYTIGMILLGLIFFVWLMLSFRPSMSQLRPLGMGFFVISSVEITDHFTPKGGEGVLPALYGGLVFLSVISFLIFIFCKRIEGHLAHSADDSSL